MAAENAGCSHSTARILEIPLSLKSSRCHTSEAGQDVRACQIGRVSSRTTRNRRDVVCGLMRQSFLPSRSSGCHRNCQRRCSGKIRTKLSAAYFTTQRISSRKRAFGQQCRKRAAALNIRQWHCRFFEKAQYKLERVTPI